MERRRMLGRGPGPGNGEREILGKVVPAYQESLIVLTACRLGIFNALAGRPQRAPDLAADLGLVPRGAEILLNALTALGLLEKAHGIFSLATQAEEHLVAGRPGYLGDLLLHQERMAQRWIHLGEVLRGERVPAEDVDPRAVTEFVGAMEANARRIGPGVAGLVDLLGVRRMLDLGGGPGTYSRLFLERGPDLSAVLFDRPEVIKIARGLPENRVWKQRLRYRAGDFLHDPLGRGYDLIWASNVLHALGPSDVRLLLERCRAALARGGRLVVHDFDLQDDEAGPLRGAVFSVHMLAVTPAGRSYARGEIQAMMRRAGLIDVRTSGTAGSTVLIEGRRG